MSELWDFVRSYDPTITELPEAFAFGDSPEMADALLQLVLTGRKTATTSWPTDPSVQEGRLDIVLDGQGEPAAIIRTTKVERVPFLAVTAEFAAAEGEGDRTLDYWRREHRNFFNRVSEGQFDDAQVVQCETFELVWPQPPSSSS